MGNQSTMKFTQQDDISNNWEFIDQTDVDDCDAFEVQSFDLSDSLHSFSSSSSVLDDDDVANQDDHVGDDVIDHHDDVTNQVEGMDEEIVANDGLTDDVTAHLVDLVETVLENDKDEIFVPQTQMGCEKGDDFGAHNQMGCEKGEDFGAHNHKGDDKGGNFGVQTQMGCDKGGDFGAHNQKGDDKGGILGKQGSHNDHHGGWTLDESLKNFVKGLTCESHSSGAGYVHGYGDGEEVEEDDDEGYGVDDELVPWDVKDVFVRQRIRKSGKKSLSRNMIKTKKSAVVFTRPGCVRGKYALAVGLKAY